MKIEKIYAIDTTGSFPIALVSKDKSY